MSTDDLEEMKRQLMAEIGEIQEFNEDQSRQHAETEQQKARILEDIEQTEKDRDDLDGRVEGILKDLKDKESQMRDVFQNIEDEAEAAEKQERQNQAMREAFTEVENFAVLMDTFEGKLDGKVQSIKDQMTNGGQLAPIDEEQLRSPEEEEEIGQLKGIHQEQLAEIKDFYQDQGSKQEEINTQLKQSRE